MKYLLDANIWLELVLERTHADSVDRFLNRVGGRQLATTDFAIHAIGCYITRQRPDLFRAFLDDIVADKVVFVLHTHTASLHGVLDAMTSFRLDFDDALHHQASVQHDLQIVSYDADFDRTPRGRVTPEDVLASMEAGA